MTTRLAEGKRIRTIQLYHTRALATTVGVLLVTDSHLFQDDVTLIGMLLSNKFNLLDAHANADGDADGMIEVTRQASERQPGVLAQLQLKATWSAAIVLGGEMAKDLLIMFPHGYGVEVDEGESLNLLYSVTWTGAGGNLSFEGSAIIYYVER